MEPAAGLGDYGSATPTASVDGMTGTIDVLGLPVGEGGVSVIRREADVLTLLVLGVVTAIVPPLAIVAAIVVALAFGFNVFGPNPVSLVAFAAILALLLVAPVAITRPLLRRWATFDARYEISPSGVRRTAQRSSGSLVFRIPEDTTFSWDELVSIGGKDSSRINVQSNAAFLPWYTRRIQLRARSPFVISGLSDWLNPWPAVYPRVSSSAIDELDAPWTRLRLEDFIVACIAAFANHARPTHGTPE